MITDASRTYESLVDAMQDLKASDNPLRRDLLWVSERRLALARGLKGEPEVLVAGAQPRSRVVQRHSRNQMVYRPGQTEPLDLLHISFPALPHFDQFAAFITSELQRLSANNSAVAAFGVVEPLIELAFAQHLATTTALTAFATRLLALEALVSDLPSSLHEVAVSAFTDSDPWRDLSVDGLGAIIRGTDRHTSVHRIRNASEVTVAVGETSLVLLSVGLDWDQSRFDSARSPWDIIEGLERILRPLGHETWLTVVAWMERFRASDAFAYVHKTASTDPVLQQQFTLTFQRVFDLSDDDGVLTNPDIVSKRRVVGSTLTYDIEMHAFGDSRDRSGLTDLAGLFRSRLLPQG